jgi:hypothetical protein
MTQNNKDLKPIPPFAKSLLESLDELFPEQCASVNENINEIMFKAGQRSVIRFLMEEYKQQQEGK